MNEIWKDIVGYEGLYQVSNLGNIRSLCFGSRNHKKSNVIKLLKQTPTNCGYYKVQLYNNGHSKILYVHRIVAETFIPNPDCKPQVNHIDGNKSNNACFNLEWSSPSENQLHAIKTNLRAPSPMTGRKGKQNPLSKPILQFTKSGEFVKKWDSIADAGRFFNCDQSCISSALVGRNKTSHGFVWKYDI